MKTSIILAILPILLTGCGITVGAEAPSDPCPPAACGWVDDPATGVESCSAPFAFAEQQRFESLDDGASACWIYDTVCVTPGVTAECVPQACRREHVTCQPMAPQGLP